MNYFLSLILITISTLGFGRYATEITVAQDGTGDFKTIQSAINATKAFPDKAITITIKKGVYKEKVIVYAWNNNLRIIGEDRANTIITWGDYFDKIGLGRNSTFHTYTMKIDANDTQIQNLTIENTAGPVGQAVALHVDADRVAIKNCSITGHQDTIYASGENLRNFFEDCSINGTTDFIFGSATVIFSKCIIESKSNSYITAASTTKDSGFGFVFLNCKLIASDDVTEVYLGRPWRSYAKTAFINCELGKHIKPEGWDNWSSSENEKTAFYAEYGSKGSGANPSKRVSWSKQLSKKEASSYTPEIIFGNWKP